MPRHPLSPQQFAENVAEFGGGSANRNMRPLIPGADKGYMVSDFGHEKRFPGNPSAQNIESFRSEKAPQLQRPGAYTGAWTYGGDTFLDVSRRVMDKPAAMKRGERQGQLGIYDLEKDRSIKLLQGPLQGRNKGTLFAGLPREERQRIATSNSELRAKNIQRGLAQKQGRRALGDYYGQGNQPHGHSALSPQQMGGVRGRQGRLF